MDYGAKGGFESDGVTDDTAAINTAISDQNRCGNGCASSTLTPAIVFFPSGNYLVSGSIIPFYLTQLVGDATNPPTITAKAGFGGSVIDADPYTANGQYWTNQNNFFKSIRHFVIDLTRTSATSGATGIHWQVAQATTLVDIVINMNTDPSTNHQGIFMENGSGGYMNGLIMNGGQYGLNVGNQQFTVRNLTVNGARTGIYANWAWGWTFQDLNINNCAIGFEINAGVGSEVIIDGNISNTPIFVRTLDTSDGDTVASAGSIVLDNIQFSNVTYGVVDSSNVVRLAGGTTTIREWFQGDLYAGTGTTPSYQQSLGASPPEKPSALLDSNGKIYSRSRTDYPQYAASAFASVKAAGAIGDGVTDDTVAIKSFIAANWGCKILFFDSGTYMVTDTILVPTGSIVVGEVWTLIIGDGANFADQNNPRAVIQVGAPGDKGLVEISDMVFSARSGSAGAIIVEWNTGDQEGQQATVAAWDVHIRLGGFTGSNLQLGNCAKLSGHAINPCIAAFIGLHITSQASASSVPASAYLEGTWVWTADHDLDDPDQSYDIVPVIQSAHGLRINYSQIDVYTGRGIVTETVAGPVWLIGTASEHASIVQYNFANARNVYAGFIQTETAYYQPEPPAPDPFSISTTYSDPTLTNGNSGWGLAIGGTASSVFIYGAGHYSFFQNWNGTYCLTPDNCQNAMVKVASTATDTYIFGLSTVGSTIMLVVDSTSVILESDNADGFASTFALWKSSDTGGVGTPPPFTTSLIPTTTTTTSTTTSTTFPAPTAMAYQGCWSDQANPRTLGLYSTSQANMTNFLCLTICVQLGYIYSGTEYYTQCYCGNSLSLGTLDPVDSDCNEKCGGGSDMCGGGYLLSVYTASSSNTTAIVGTSTTISSSSTTSTTAPTSTLASSYVGCYVDQASPRTLPGYYTSDPSMTNQLCLSTCVGLGYTYSGTEYYTECYCGNTLNGAILDPVDTDCNQACGGGVGECGGSWRLSVYTTAAGNNTSSSTPTSTSIVPTPTSSGIQGPTGLAAKRGLAWPKESVSVMYTFILPQLINPAAFDPNVFTVDNTVNWIYNWDIAPSSANQDFGAIDEFYFMQWGSGGIEDIVTNFAASGSKTILGFNEPDNGDQANIDPVTAASCEYLLFSPIKTANPSVKLISPAVTNGGAPSGLAWLQDFFGNCTVCELDGIAVHWYGGWTSDFQDFVTDATAFNLPIYMTEIGLSWDQYATTDSWNQFLPLALQILDNEPLMAKYAFFGAFYDGTG
ncbi:hypothetical protein FRB98_006108 [Tulasnella sp. 332]|nr:hypothetical protein FRB98_006108 [Tulasnella sp. 332]